MKNSLPNGVLRKGINPKNALNNLSFFRFFRLLWLTEEKTRGAYPIFNFYFGCQVNTFTKFRKNFTPISRMKKRKLSCGSINLSFLKVTELLVRLGWTSSYHQNQHFKPTIYPPYAQCQKRKRFPLRIGYLV
jgi:hypothetical protein